MSDEIALASVARLFGRLAIDEIDPEFADELWEPERRDALAGLGLDLPEPGDGALRTLATDYRETFECRGSSPPLVQSRCDDQARTAAAAVREIVATTGVELDEKARSAPPDHVGAELLVWAELVEEAGPAREFAARHLVWALPHLEERSDGGSFYARLAGVIAAFIRVIASR